MFGIKGIETEWPEVYMSVTMLAFLLGTHIFYTRGKQARNDPMHVFMTCFLLVSSFIFIAFALAGARMDLQSALIIVATVGVCTFIIIGEAMVRGLADRLTTWRTDKWVKELDYIYLLLGAFGLAMAVNRIEGIKGRIEGYEIVGPLVLGIALAVRFIKTRAEVEDWNKVTPTLPPTQSR